VIQQVFQDMYTNNPYCIPYIHNIVKISGKRSNAIQAGKDFRD